MLGYVDNEVDFYVICCTTHGAFKKIYICWTLIVPFPPSTDIMGAITKILKKILSSKSYFEGILQKSAKLMNKLDFYIFNFVSFDLYYKFKFASFINWIAPQIRMTRFKC